MVVNGDAVCDADDDVGLLMQSANADGKVADDGNDDNVAVVNGDNACDDYDCKIADGCNSRADDANVVGMGRGSGVRPWRLPILILCCVVDAYYRASWYVEEQLNR